MKNNDPSKSIWPYGLIAFFAVFITWLAIFVGIAVTHSSELVGADYYEQEIRYQERIDSLKRAAGTSGIRMEQNASGSDLVLRLPSEHAGRPVDGTVTFYRASDARLDRVHPLTPDGSGLQTLPTSDLARGLWKVEARWTVGGEEFFADRQIVLK